MPTRIGDARAVHAPVVSCMHTVQFGTPTCGRSLHNHIRYILICMRHAHCPLTLVHAWIVLCVNGWVRCRYVGGDELVEVTPDAIRLRKEVLDASVRRAAARRAASAGR